MKITHAILGLLSTAPLSGYDLKKLMQDSPYMYWTGNNNQIYKALLELTEVGFVSCETKYQENAPTKKNYYITDQGRQALKEWSLTEPEEPEIKKPFLIQLAWSDQLTKEEILIQLGEYEHKLEQTLKLEQERALRQNRITSGHQSVFHEIIADNIISTYENELAWTKRAKIKLMEEYVDIDVERLRYDDRNKVKSNLPKLKGKEKIVMNYEVKKFNKQKYIELGGEGKQIESEQDGLDIISLCWEKDVNRVLIHEERLSEDFFDLKTRLLGAVLQKFDQYGIKVLVVIGADRAKGRFREFVIESNKGNMFHASTEYEEGLTWLLGR